MRSCSDSCARDCADECKPPDDRKANIMQDWGMKTIENINSDDDICRGNARGGKYAGTNEAYRHWKFVAKPQECG